MRSPSEGVQVDEEPFCREADLSHLVLVRQVAMVPQRFVPELTNPLPTRLDLLGDGGGVGPAWCGRPFRNESFRPCSDIMTGPRVRPHDHPGISPMLDGG